MLKEIYKKVMVVSLAIGFITVLVHLLVKQIQFDLLDALIGVAFGMLLCIVRFKMLYKSILKEVDTDVNLAKKVGMTGYIARYILTAVVLVLAVLYKLETFITLAVTLVLATEISARLVKPQTSEKGGNEVGKW